ICSGREKVGAAISDPCSRLISNFNIKADRLTISRQRPLYFDFAIHSFQKRAVSWKRCSTNSISGCCPWGRTAPKTNVTFSPARRLNSEIASWDCCRRAMVEYNASGGQLSLAGEKIAHRSSIFTVCYTSHVKRGWHRILKSTSPLITAK